MPTTANEQFDYIRIDTGGGVFTNRDLEARSITGTSFSVLEGTDDFLYLGDDDKFDMAIFDIDTVGSFTAPLKYEYYNGSSFAEFIPDTQEFNMDQADDGTYTGEAYGFAGDGVEIFPMRVISDWAKTTVDEGQSAYWIRISAPNGITTAATVKNIRKRPVEAYCTTQEVFELLQLANVTNTTDFTTATIPTKITVEAYIAGAQSQLDYQTRKSWRMNYVADEKHDFNIFGFKPDRRDVYKILDLAVWDGSQFDSRTQGRQKDYFLVRDTGMVHFSRYFFLPARFRGFNTPTFRFGGGEFITPVRIKYLYGRNLATDVREGGFVTELAKKMAAIEILKNSDFGNLTVSGMDRVPLQQKIQLFTTEIVEGIESLKGVEIF
jgi:hypothetical protein